MAAEKGTPTCPALEGYEPPIGRQPLRLVFFCSFVHSERAIRDEDQSDVPGWSLSRRSSRVAVGGPMKTIDTLLPAFGLSWSLRHPLRTGTSLTGGVRRRSGDTLVVLHDRNSMGILSDFGTASAASESIGSLCASAGDTDAV